MKRGFASETLGKFETKDSSPRSGRKPSNPSRCRPFHGLARVSLKHPGVTLASSLHPRLYAIACFAGLKPVGFAGLKPVGFAALKPVGFAALKPVCFAALKSVASQGLKPRPASQAQRTYAMSLRRGTRGCVAASIANSSAFVLSRSVTSSWYSCSAFTCHRS